MNSYYPIHVKPLEKYQLLITFDNNEQRVFDVTPYLDDKFFSPLRNLLIFDYRDGYFGANVNHNCR